MATDVLTVNARCDECDVSVTAVVIDDHMSAEVAEFFRAHTHHPAGGPATGAQPSTPGRRPRFWSRRTAAGDA